MKGFLLTTIILSIPLLGLAYWMFRPRFQVVRARLNRALKVVGVLYLAMIAYRLASSGVTESQLDVAALSLVFFGGVWVVAWIVTRSVAGR